jgi:hypothetical protein
MSNIPEARAQLAEIAADVRAAGDNATAERIRRVIESHMVRESPVRRTGQRSRPLTEDRADEIRAYAAGPGRGLTLHEIATQFGVNQGRVSEVLTGKR